MPFSHFAVTVSDIARASAFYEAALQPLGYRYLGRQADSLGFGIDSADFFLTPAPYKARISPIHIAFDADSRAIVRECYSAALAAQGLPNGAPNFHNEDCSCYNAAVKDLDGHIIEFILRQPHGCSHPDEQESRVLTWQKGVAKSALIEDDDARSETSRRSSTKSRVQTVLDLASSTSRSVKVPEPTAAPPAPRTSGGESEIVVNTLLGAAAGAVITLGTIAFFSSERSNARDEANFESYRRSTRQTATMETIIPPTQPTHPTVASRAQHRNYSTTESVASARRSDRMLAIGANPYNNDSDIRGVYDSRHPPPRRITEEYFYASPSASDREVSETLRVRRASTLPLEAEAPKLLLEAPQSTTSHRSSRQHPPKSMASSRHSSHHHRSSHDGATKISRHDSGVSLCSSSRTRRERCDESGKNSSATTVKPSPSGRRDSIVQSSSEKAASRINAPEREPAAVAPSPSRAASKTRRPDSDYEYAVTRPLPDSKASSTISAAKYALPHSVASTRVSAAQKPTSKSVVNEKNLDAAAAEEVADVLPDMPSLAPIDESQFTPDTTVMPGDSISVVDLRPQRHRSKHHHHHHHGSTASTSRRSEASDRTARPRKDGGGGGSRHSALTMPVRTSVDERERGRRGVSRRSVQSYS